MSEAADKMNIRDSNREDLEALKTLYPKAFPDEDLVPLVLELLDIRDDVLSLVAESDAGIVGHVVFTRCGVTGGTANVILLGPLAVAPASQKQGIGTALVRAGMDRVRQAGGDLVCVLGDPAYYSRFGFTGEHYLEPPYALPAEWEGAWQSLQIGDTPCSVAGKLTVPGPWNRRELWAP